MLGASLVRFFKSKGKYDVYGLGRSQSSLLPPQHQITLDLAAADSSIVSLDFVPDYIVHTAALTDLTLCEKEPQKANLVHVDGSAAIAKLGGEETKFFYISTDSVFDGKRGNYTEHDIPHPVNEYASSKLKGELAVQRAAQGEVTILRTNIYGYHVPMRNSLAEWAYLQWAAGKAIMGFTDTIFNAVLTSQLATIIEQMIEQNTKLPLLNVGSSEAISKFEFLDRLRAQLGVNADLLQMAVSADFPSAIQRPKDTSLNTSLLSGLFQVPDFESGIKDWVESAKIDFHR